MQEILELDFYFFYLINSGLTNSLFDFLLPILRFKLTWIPFYLFLIWYLVSRYKKIGLIISLAAILTVGFSDYTSSSLIKKSIERERPCNIEQPPYPVIQRIGCGGYSFTSSHATNHFALSVFLILIIGKRFQWIKWPLLIWASTISFSQIYVGVHFPLDIFGGALLGTFIAFFAYKIVTHYFPEIELRKNLA